jgi:hypothetical protein
MSEFSSRDVSSFDEPNVARHTVKKEKDAMKNARRFSFLVVTLIALASMLALHAPAGAQTDRNRLEASFTESAASITNRIADLGVFQIINTGTGTLEGFGPATMVLGVTQDRSVQPCGPGSWTNAAIRRITVAAGTLVIRELAYVCQTASGPVATSTWTVDGASSSGAFADARGSGEGSVDLTTRTTTLSGKLKLAADE